MAQTFEAATTSHPVPTDIPFKANCGNSKAIFDILFLTEEIVCVSVRSVCLCM